ncbi:hypothetical protein F5Y16DRAFT_177586 [Xylariaceae sp. FL0255]|nr:hypothetical protein F5Y16DRAFT_177586 [Xylariaceae sp. FL0255]
MPSSTRQAKTSSDPNSTPTSSTYSTSSSSSDDSNTSSIHQPQPTAPRTRLSNKLPQNIPSSSSSYSDSPSSDSSSSDSSSSDSSSSDHPPSNVSSLNHSPSNPLISKTTPAKPSSSGSSASKVSSSHRSSLNLPFSKVSSSKPSSSSSSISIASSPTASLSKHSSSRPSPSQSSSSSHATSHSTASSQHSSSTPPRSLPKPTPEPTHRPQTVSDQPLRATNAQSPPRQSSPFSEPNRVRFAGIPSQRLSPEGPVHPLPPSRYPQASPHDQNPPRDLPHVVPCNHHYMYPPQSGLAVQPSLRDRPVFVSLGPTIRPLVCNRGDILDHFPNTRQEPFGRTFVPRIGRRNLNSGTVSALKVIFQGLEQFRLTGAPLYIFESARDLLNHRNREYFRHAFFFFFSVCMVLDTEYGLGCSDAILQQIDEFAIDLIYSHELGMFDLRMLFEFFLAYSRVFQPTTQRHLDTLRELFSMIPVGLRSRLLFAFSDALQQMPRRSNAHVMFRTMRELSMA